MSEGISPNARRWLNTIAFAEGTWGGGAPRYDITFGYTPIKDLSRHPDRVVRSGKYASAAAGAYQFMPATWERAQRALGLKDFGPQSQDLAALYLLRQRGIDPNKDPITPETIAKVSGEWASLPNLAGKSAYGQPVKSFEQLKNFAQSSGAASSQAQATDAESEAATSLLLNEFIKLVSRPRGVDLKTDLLTSSIPAPELPGYEEEPEADLGVEILSDIYKNRQQDDAVKQAMQQDASLRLQQNLIAADQAKSQLLAQALSAFATPKSVI
jgi:muramidase (phage lysozyme)